MPVPHCVPLAFAICPDCFGGPDAVACDFCDGSGRVLDEAVYGPGDAVQGQVVSGGEDERH